MSARKLIAYALPLLGLFVSACSAAAVEPPPDPVRVETPLPDQPVGSSPSSTPVPTPGGSMRQGPIYVDEVELVMMESFPVQVRLILRGSLPNPCSSFAWEVEE